MMISYYLYIISEPLIKSLNIFLEFHWLGGYGEQCMLVNVPQLVLKTC